MKGAGISCQELKCLMSRIGTDFTLKIRFGHLVGSPRNDLATILEERKEDINLPADGSARHGGNNPRAHSASETTPAILAFDDSSCIE